jgi:hypothetical protein
MEASRGPTRGQPGAKQGPAGGLLEASQGPDGGQPGASRGQPGAKRASRGPTAGQLGAKWMPPNSKKNSKHQTNYLCTLDKGMDNTDLTSYTNMSNKLAMLVFGYTTDDRLLFGLDI